MTESGSDAAIQSRRDGATLVLTLARPDMGNALRHQDTEALADAVQDADDDGDIRSILIRAEGKHFCTGADLRVANAPDTKPRVGHMVRGLESGAHRLIETLWNCRLPTVSAIQGRAMGLGVHLAVVCDFVLCTVDAVFSEPFSERGFSVDSGGSFLLPRLIGIRRTRQMLLRGRPVDATTAAAWGLVDEVVDPDSLDEAAAALAGSLAAGPTFALGHTKELLNRRAPSDLAAALRAEADAVEAPLRSADFKEGIRAFKEHRDPVFSGQ
jgi:2-(1,2-epoxy-1,2-dihydrophenyl)acetyl-CoA isomerase